MFLQISAQSVTFHHNDGGCPFTSRGFAGKADWRLLRLARPEPVDPDQKGLARKRTLTSFGSLFIFQL